MSPLRLEHETGEAVTLRLGERLLCRYVYAPAAPAHESPKPYLHPVNTLAGDTLTNHRPNDHPWHHALALAVNGVGGRNFWGGPTCRREDGYQWRDDHGEQRHLAWTRLDAAGGEATLAHTLAWSAGGELLLREERTLAIAVEPEETWWSLDWRSRLENVSGRALELSQPHSAAGLAGSHYTGLALRGARGLLDDHGDREIQLLAAGGLDGEKAVHGAAAPWMAWIGQHDTTLRRSTVLFIDRPGNPGYPNRWFVRRNYPLMAFPFHFDRNHTFAANAHLELNHRLVFANGAWDRPRLDRFAGTAAAQKGNP
jgi:hypothetical protein